MKSVLIIGAVILSFCANPSLQAFFVPKMDMYMEIIKKLESRTGFHAMSIDPDIRVGYPVRFTDILMNVGGRYSPTTGLFTAATNGTYFFSVNICMYNQKWFQVKIEAAGLMIATVSAIGHDGVCLSGTGLAVMTAGQIAKVTCTKYDAGALFEDNRRRSSFSGTLLYPDQGTYLNYTLPTSSVGPVDKRHPLLFTAPLWAYILILKNKTIA